MTLCFNDSLQYFPTDFTQIKMVVQECPYLAELYLLIYIYIRIHTYIFYVQSCTTLFTRVLERKHV